MKRVDTSTNTASLPAYAAGPNTPGYFTEGAPGVEDGTIPGQDWFNMVQEELANAITDDGDTLDGADDGQLAERLSPLKGIRTSATDTGPVSTTHGRAVVASGTSQATGDYAAALASTDASIPGDDSAAAGTVDSSVDGRASAAVASWTAAVDGTCSASVAAFESTVTGNRAAALASEYVSVLQARSAALASGAPSLAVTVDKSQSAMIASVGSKIAESFDAQGSVLLGGVRCELATDGAIATGYHATTIPTYNGTNQNLTWKVAVATGEVTADGSFTGGGADYAELFEALDHAAPPPVGALVAREGGRCRLAQPGDRVLGAHSAAPALVGNAAPMSWTGRFVRDEWGRRVRVTHPNGVTWYQEAEGYDASAPYVPRTERPGWVPVALLGQIPIRVDATVRPDDDVTAGADGVGTRGTGRGRAVECIAITSPYDAERGYAIALCLVG